MGHTPTRHNADICSKNVKNSNIVTLYHTDWIQITKRNYNALKANCGRNKTVLFASFRVIGMDIDRSANSSSVKFEFNAYADRTSYFLAL